MQNDPQIGRPELFEDLESDPGQQTGARRSPQLPDVPTLGEAFLPGFEASTWGMVIGPAGIPAPVLAKLNADIRAALQVQSVMTVTTPKVWLHLQSLAMLAQSSN